MVHSMAESLVLHSVLNSAYCLVTQMVSWMAQSSAWHLAMHLAYCLVKQMVCWMAGYLVGCLADWLVRSMVLESNILAFRK